MIVSWRRPYKGRSLHALPKGDTGWGTAECGAALEWMPEVEYDTRPRCIACLSAVLGFRVSRTALRVAAPQAIRGAVYDGVMIDDAVAPVDCPPDRKLAAAGEGGA